MLLCTSYYQDHAHRALVDQVRFSIYVLNNAIEYAAEHSDKQLIIEITDLNEVRNDKNVCPSFDKMHELQESFNFIYDFYDIEDMIAYAKQSDPAQHKYMYHFPVQTWNVVQMLMGYKVSDMVIGEPLTFNRREVTQYIRNKGVRIHAIPHRGKNHLTMDLDIPGIKSFWILPQHMSLYEGFIDVLELLDNNVTRESALIDVYIKQSYDYAMNLLIPTIETDMVGSFWQDNQVEPRLYCQQRCMKSNKLCHHCELIMQMYNTLKQKHKQESLD